MAGIASICVAYGAGSLMSTMHGSCSPTANGHTNGDIPHQPAMRLGEPSNKFSLHHILRTGFPGLQVCFEAQEILCQAWMPNVAKILVSFTHIVHGSYLIDMAERSFNTSFVICNEMVYNALYFLDL